MNRNIRITTKGYAILAALDAGTYRTLSTNEARAIAGRRQSSINNAKRQEGSMTVRSCTDTAKEKAMALFLKDEIVEAWFDEGGGRQHGPRIIYGQVIKSGPKTATIRWESGICNRVRHHSYSVKHARDYELAVECLAKAGY